MPSMENIRQTVVVALGAPANAAQLAALFANTDLLVKKVTLINGAAIIADNTNYITLQLKSGAAVVASLDTRLANQGAVAALVGKAFVVDATGLAQLLGGATLSLGVALAGSAVLTGAQLQIEYVRTKGN